MQDFGSVDQITERTNEAALVIERAVDWLHGEAVLALAPVDRLDVDRWNVSGLDDDGHELPARRVERAVEGAVDVLAVDERDAGHLAVRGHYPSCSAAGLYRAAGLDHAWLVITDSRVGVLVERPDEAVFEARYELPRHALGSITRWKQPMVPEFKGGPRFAQIGFADSSWARVRTDEDGLAALLSQP